MGSASSPGTWLPHPASPLVCKPLPQPPKGGGGRSQCPCGASSWPLPSECRPLILGTHSAAHLGSISFSVFPHHRPHPWPEPLIPSLGPGSCPLQTKPGVIQPLAQAWPRGSPAPRGRDDPCSVSALARRVWGVEVVGGNSCGAGGGCSPAAVLAPLRRALSPSPAPRPPLMSCPPM